MHTHSYMNAYAGMYICILAYLLTCNCLISSLLCIFDLIFTYLLLCFIDSLSDSLFTYLFPHFLLASFVSFFIPCLRTRFLGLYFHFLASFLNSLAYICYMHSYIHTYMHTYKHTYIHTFILL